MSLISRLRGSPFAFPLAALAALAMFCDQRGLVPGRDLVARPRSASAAIARTELIQTLRQALLDAETGQRGYLLTGGKEYLQPYTAGAQRRAARRCSPG